MEDEELISVMDSVLRCKADVVESLHQALDVKQTHVVACDTSSFDSLSEDARNTIAARVRLICEHASDHVVRFIYAQMCDGLAHGIKPLLDAGIIAPVTEIQLLRQEMEQIHSLSREILVKLQAVEHQIDGIKKSNA